MEWTASAVANGANGNETNGVSEPGLFGTRAGPSISIPTMSYSKSSNPNSVQQYIVGGATGFLSEINRLSDKLDAAERKISEQEAIINQQNVNLSEAADIMTEQQRRLETLEEEFGLEGGDLKEIKAMAARERKEKADVEEKYKRLKESMKSITDEFKKFMEEMQTDYLVAEPTALNENNGGESSQDKLNKLSDYVQNKFVAWAKSQMELKAELGRMQKIIQNLTRILESKSKSAPQEPPQPTAPILNVTQKKPNTIPVTAKPTSNKKQNTPTAPEPANDENEPPEDASNSSTSQIQHGEDISMSSTGFFCLCGTEYSSKSNLKIHIRVMTEEGKFKCQVCKHKFVLYYMLRRHLKDRHGITPPVNKGGRTVGCADCGKVYANFTDLYEHRGIAHPRKSIQDRQAASNSHSVNEPSTSSGTSNKNNSGTQEAEVAFIQSIRLEREPNVPFSLVKMESGDAGGQRKLISYSGKFHGMNIGKRHQGFYCICGIRFINRKRLDGHVLFQNQGQRKYTDYSDDDYEYEDLEELNVSPEIPDEMVRNEQNAINVRKEANIEEEEEVMTHMVHPGRSNECVCGYDCNNNKYNLTKHIKYHTSERKVACDLCPSKFISPSYLRSHIIRAHKIARETVMRFRIDCGKCGRKFSNKERLIAHMKIIHGIRGTRALSPKLNRRVPVVSNTPPRSSRSVTRSTRGKFSCEHCDSKFKRLSQLVKHLKFVHNITQTGLVIGCVDCGIAFATRREHAQHRISVHQSAIGISKKNQMAASENEPSPPVLRAQQRRAQTPTRPSTPATTPRKRNTNDSQEDPDHEEDTSRDGEGYYCICGTSFAEKRNLRSHVKSKTLEWNFKCHLCTKSFFYNAELRRHMLSRHHVESMNSSRRKEFGCVTCGGVFDTRFEMCQHVKLVHKATEDDQTRASANRSRALSENPEVEEPDHGVDVMRVEMGHYCLCGKRCTSERTLNTHIQAHG